MTKQVDMDDIKQLQECVEGMWTGYKAVAHHRDALKTIAKEVLFVLKEAGLYNELQEKLQLAISNLPKEAAKEKAVAEDPKPNENKGG